MHNNNQDLKEKQVFLKLMSQGIKKEDAWAYMFDQIGQDFRSFTTPCPFCQGARELKAGRAYKLQVNFPKPMVYCHKCTTKHYGYYAIAVVLGLWKHEFDGIFDDGLFLSDYGVNLILGLFGIEDLKTDLSKSGITQMSSNILKMIQQRAKEAEANIYDQSNVLPIHAPEMAYDLDRVYSFWFNNLLVKNSPYMDEDLAKRGFSPQDVLRYGYATTQMAYSSSELLKMFGGNLDNVPGLYRNGAVLETTLPQTSSLDKSDCYICPVRNIFGHLCGAQIRSKNLQAKYYALSSASKDGPSAVAYAHYVGFLERTCIITEGVTKANAIHKFTGRFTCGLLGVNNQTGFFRELDRAIEQGLGVERFVIAYDMDRFENKHVKKAITKLRAGLTARGLQVSELIWDKEYKGLDDYLLYLSQNGLLDEFKTYLDGFYID